jgi:hypothetical protein
MRIRTLLAAIAVTTVLFCAHHAFAFTVNEKSGTNPDGSAHYVDPDEQLSPSVLFGWQSQGDERNDDASARNTAPTFDRNDQLMTLPDRFFSTQPPRR